MLVPPRPSSLSVRSLSPPKYAGSPGPQLARSPSLQEPAGAAARVRELEETVAQLRRELALARAQTLQEHTQQEEENKEQGQLEEEKQPE